MAAGQTVKILHVQSQQMGAGSAARFPKLMATEQQRKQQRHRTTSDGATSDRSWYCSSDS
jgi:hypothetical protein